MHIGYARVSTYEQSMDLQRDALERVGCERIFEDTLSGVKAERPGLTEALAYLRAGDTLIVWRLDRLGRSLKQLIELANELKARGVGFKSLREDIDTSSATGQFFFHVTAAFAELERDLIRERTRAGLEVARARGRLGGRPRALDKKTFAMALQLYEANQSSVTDICERLDIKPRTFYRYLKKHREGAALGR